MVVLAVAVMWRWWSSIVVIHPWACCVLGCHCCPVVSPHHPPFVLTAWHLATHHPSFVLTAHHIKYYFKNLVRIINSQMKTKRNIPIVAKWRVLGHTTLWHWPCSSQCCCHDLDQVVVWGIKTCLNVSWAVLGLFQYFLLLSLPASLCWWCVLGLICC